METWFWSASGSVVFLYLFFSYIFFAQVRRDWLVTPQKRKEEKKRVNFFSLVELQANLYNDFTEGVGTVQIA